MRPFNLEAALSGAKLVTRSGDKVFGFKEREVPSMYSFIANIESEGFFAYDHKGRYISGEEGTLDLFLADEPQPSPHIFITEIEKFLSGSAQKIYPKQAKILQQHLNKFMEDYPQFKTGK